MSEEQEKAIIDKVIEGFDFEKARSAMYLTKKDIHDVPSIAEMKERARRFLKMALERRDRPFWWIGGLAGQGGMCATWDDKWGLSLHYVLTGKRVRVGNQKQQTNGTEDTE